MLLDDHIQALLSEKKILPHNWRTKLKTKKKANTCHAEKELEIPRAAGGSFRIILRQNLPNPFDFSVILVYEDPTRKSYILRRYNGKHPSGHTNKREKANGGKDYYFRNVFHIHTATERYQTSDYDIDGYAEATGKYVDFKTAFERFIEDHAFELPAPFPSESGIPFDMETIQ